jgi:hypothetical protein
MSLQSKEIIEIQKTNSQKAVKDREDILKNKGVENRMMLKDSTLKSLKAKVRQIDLRYRSICASETRGQAAKSSTEEA